MSGSTRLYLTALGAFLALAVFSAQAASIPLDDGGRFIFVPDRGAPRIAVIDGTTDTVVATLELPSIPDQIVISDSMGQMVASNVADRTIAIVDLKTRQTLAVVTLDIAPDFMQLSPDGYFLAIGDEGGGTVMVVALELGSLLSRAEGLQRPYNMRFSEDSSIIYVANRGADHVSVIYGRKGSVVAEIPVLGPGSDPRHGGVTNVTVTPDGLLGFATLDRGDLLAVLDLVEDKWIKTLTLGRDPWRAYGTADGRTMLVPNNGDRTVSVIDAEKAVVTATLPGARDMISVNTGWFDTTAFVTSRGDNKLVVLDLEAMAKAGEIALPGTPGAGVVTPDGRKLYIAIEDAGKVAVIDTQTRRLTTLIDGVGLRPSGATMGRSNNYCH